MAAALFIVGLAQAQSPPPSVADIKMLAKGGISEEVILSQIRNSHATYRLSTTDILDLKDAGVSQKVIDFMINTAGTSSMGPTPTVSQMPPPTPPPGPAVVEAAEGSEPPPPIVEQVVVSPGPGYIWIGGYWAWHHYHWEWVRGRWEWPPRRNAVWVGGYWDHHGGRVIWVDGYWR
jgi:WXXGXW repeat (2 copies)